MVLNRSCASRKVLDISGRFPYDVRMDTARKKRIEVPCTDEELATAKRLAGVARRTVADFVRYLIVKADKTEVTRACGETFDQYCRRCGVPEADKAEEPRG